MPSVLNIYKPIGATPLEIIKKTQAQFPEYRDIPVGYAGRLDPMAEGILLLLLGEENKKRKLYERLGKTYEFEVLFGVTTDTYDALGIIEKVQKVSLEEIQEKLPPIIKRYPKSFDQPYPPYSSVRVKGKPLFYWARKRTIDKIVIPSKNVTIEDFNLLNLKEVSLSEIHLQVLNNISKVHGDFRQEEIIKGWAKSIEASGTMACVTARISISCSSGLYVRSVAHMLGKQLRTGAIAISIKRTRIGTYRLEDSIRLT